MGFGFRLVLRGGPGGQEPEAVGTGGIELRIDGTEVQVRRPRAGRPGRKAFVSGKVRNTVKTTIFSDAQGRTLFSGIVRPGRMKRFTGRHETYAETHLAIAGLVSDRSVRRATRRKPSTDLVLVQPSAC